MCIHVCQGRSNVRKQNSEKAEQNEPVAVETTPTSSDTAITVLAEFQKEWDQRQEHKLDQRDKLFKILTHQINQIWVDIICTNTSVWYNIAIIAGRWWHWKVYTQILCFKHTSGWIASEVITVNEPLICEMGPFQKMDLMKTLVLNSTQHNSL